MTPLAQNSFAQARELPAAEHDGFLQHAHGDNADFHPATKPCNQTPAAASKTMRINLSPSRFAPPSGRPNARPPALFPSGPDTATKGKLLGKVPGGATNKMLPSLLLRSPLCRAAAAAAVLLIPCTPCLGQAALLNLPILPGAETTTASDVSADGSTVVGHSLYYTGGQWSTEAFRWTPSGGLVGLGTLPDGEGGSIASAVSADGSTVVGESSREAFRWTGDGGMVGLGFLPGGDFSQANAISADGSTVVGRSLTASVWEAFRWTGDGGMVGLGDLPGGTFKSQASAISADGSIVVGVGESASGSEAFLWTDGGGMVGLGDLPGGTFKSHASAMSADGSTVVGGSSSAAGPHNEAFHWTSDGGMVGLGVLPGATSSFAIAVSGDGSTIVGNSGASSLQAFVWTEDGGMQSLWEVLLAGGVDPAADGWTHLSSATGISADGDTIVGFGTRNGDSTAFMVVLSDRVDHGDPLLAIASPVDLALDGLVQALSIPFANDGPTQTLRILSVEVGGPAAANFQVTSFSQAVGPGDTGEIALEFDPMGAAGVYEAVLSITSNDFSQPIVDVALRGELTEVLRDPMASFGPAPSPMLDAETGTAFLAIPLSNLGASRDLTITALTFSGPDAENFSWAGTGSADDPSPVAPSGSGTVGITFGALGRAGLFSALVTMASNDPIEPSVTIPISVFREGTSAALRYLGPGGDGPFSPSGISADGSTVVGGSSSPSGQEAARWTSGAGHVGLGFLPGADVRPESYALGVSADGSTTVGFSTAEDLNNFNEPNRVAVLWTSVGGIVDLHNLPAVDGDRSSRAYAVSADGSVVVGQVGRAGAQAFRWTGDGGMVGLGFLPGGRPTSSRASGVSADGSTVVGRSSSISDAGGYPTEAFLWTDGGGMVGLGDLPGGIFRSEAKAISADGSTVVGGSSSASGPDTEAFLWTSDGGMVGLGFVPGEGFSRAYAVSADGSTVGGWVGYDEPSAFVWTKRRGMRKLWDVLLAGGVDPAADGWTRLVNISGISADGEIVGYGTRNDGSWASFMAVLPKGIPEGELVAPRIALSGGNVDLVVRESVPGRRYLVETSVNALEGTWTTIGTEHVGDGGPLTISVPHDPADPQRFYRLVLDAPPAIP